MASQSIYFQSVNCTPASATARRLVLGMPDYTDPRFNRHDHGWIGVEGLSRLHARIDFIVADRRRSVTPIDLFIYIVYRLYIS